MKKSDGTIVMSGEEMEVLLEASCVTKCAPLVAAKLPTIMSRLCESLCIREVSRYFINDIRIGETVALVDNKNGYTYRIRMESHAVRILAVYESKRKLHDAVSAVYLMDWGLMRSVSGRKAVAA